MSARKFFAELFGSKNQMEITTQTEEQSSNRRLSISKSGKFRQRNKNRSEIQQDTFKSPANDNKESINVDGKGNIDAEMKTERPKRRETEI